MREQTGRARKGVDDRSREESTAEDPCADDKQMSQGENKPTQRNVPLFPVKSKKEVELTRHIGKG